MRPTIELPRDPALPGLAPIREAGLGGAIAALGLAGFPVELRLCGHTPGSRATFEARAGDRRFAVKVYAEDPVPEAELRLLVIGWLEGPTALDLVRGGQGRRAGELAGRWLERAASLPVRLGRPCGAPHMLYQTGRAVGALGAADRALKSAAKGVARMLAASVPVENA